MKWFLNNNTIINSCRFAEEGVTSDPCVFWYGFIAVWGTNILPFLSKGFVLMTSRSSTLIHLLWYDYVWYDLLDMIPYDMNQFAIHFVMIFSMLSHLIWDSVKFDTLCWLWYYCFVMIMDSFTLFCFVLLPELTSHGGTMTMSLRHQWHDTFCGGVIDPRHSLLFCYDICAHGHYVYVCLVSYWDMYFVLQGAYGGILGLFSYVLDLVIGLCVSCTPFHFWYIGVCSSLYNLWLDEYIDMIWLWLCD